MLLAAYRAAGGRDDAAPLAAAVEVVHAYSLIHDDLPCMDDEEVRRGRPTVHVAFGVAAATAAGLAMVPLAVACAADAAQRLRLPAPVVGRIVRELMQASGAGGMIGGQLLDLEGEGKPIALAQLERIHLAKTGALIAASA
ncbi:MAG: polyprenyl synthetase family protein, partial [Gemmatimonadota bacterium]|nr:polyprenyl synthetase family protein [Gemmatimonadota bacterium]